MGLCNGTLISSNSSVGLLNWVSEDTQREETAVLLLNKLVFKKECCANQPISHAQPPVNPWPALSVSPSTTSGSVSQMTPQCTTEGKQCTILGIGCNLGHTHAVLTFANQRET